MVRKCAPVIMAFAVMLGMHYMSEAAGMADSADRQHIEELERTLQANLALAFCE